MSTNTKQFGQEMRQNILTSFGVDKLPAEEQADAINQIGKIIFQMVLLRVLPTMEENEVKEYEQLIDKNVEAEDLMEFLFDKVPGLLDIIAEEVESLRQTGGEIMKHVKSDQNSN